jgi:hypothetical protein
MMEADNGLFISIDPGCASNKACSPSLKGAKMQSTEKLAAEFKHPVAR